MPRFNKRGQLAGSGAGTGPSLDNVLLVPQPNGGWVGGRSWLDDDNLIYQYISQGNSEDQYATLESINVHTRKRTRISDRGANIIISGGGRWAAMLIGRGGTEVYGAIESERAGLIYSDLDGNFAISPDYHGDVFELWAADGRITPGAAFTDARQMQVLGPTAAVWADNGVIKGVNARVPQQFGNAGSPKLVSLDNEDWVVYWNNENGLIAHPAEDPSEGYVVQPQDIAYNHDAIAVDGKLYVGYSVREGEHASEQVKHIYTLKESRVKFARSTAVETSAAQRTFFSGVTGRAPDATGASRLVQPQLGLLEDDIVYRLSLLAANVLQPLKNRYPNIVIKSGLRQVNSGVGQHELGEAVDIQINDQTPRLLYEVAKWIEASLNFDQLILNFSGTGDAWIHVSFSPNSLRGQVLTKDFGDQFHDGLFLVTAFSASEAAAARRASAEMDTIIMAELKRMQDRHARSLPTSTVQDEAPLITTTGTATAPGGVGGGGGPHGPGSGTGSGNLAGRARLVQCVQQALGQSGGSEEHNIRIAFDVAKRVAWLLRDEGCGLLIGPSGGENIIQWHGHYLRAGRVCFPDGQVYKILTGVEDGPPEFHQPGWTDDGMVDVSLYVPAIDPGTDINMNWLACSLPAGTGGTTNPNTDGPDGREGLDGRSSGFPGAEQAK